jgi:ribosomal protein S18 acetylase RimI-like enzyme
MHADYPAIARMRWLLKSDDSSEAPGCEFEAFAADYVQHLATRDAAGDTVHWLAEDGGEVVGAMTLRRVAKEPSPRSDGGARAGAIGYLTNCYVTAEHRNRGTGSALLAALVADARNSGLELLIVWPSERAVPFYRRAGFCGANAPFEMLLDEG